MELGVKKVVDKLADVMRDAVRVTGLEKLFGDNDPGQLMVMELTLYAMYLSASDGEISEEEAQQMGENFGFELAVPYEETTLFFIWPSFTNKISFRVCP